MSTETKTTQIDLDAEMAVGGFTANFITHKVRQIIFQPEFEGEDFADLEQDLKLYVLERVPLFNPEVAPWRSYVSTLVERAIATWVVRRQREAERYPMTYNASSLYVEDQDGDRVPLDTQFTMEEGERRRGLSSVSEANRISDTADVYTVMADLRPNDRDLCARLMTSSVRDVARQLGVSRSSIRKRLRRIGERFAAYGMSLTEEPREES